MKLTPLDIQQKQFGTRMRGLDAQEVRQFLELCADQMEELIQESQELAEEVRSRDALLAEVRNREHTLQEALVGAQRLANEMKEHARKESEILLAEAELEAEKIIQDAHSRRASLVSELAELKGLKVGFEADLKALVGSHLKLLETFAESDRQRDHEERVTLLHKKGAG